MPFVLIPGPGCETNYLVNAELFLCLQKPMDCKALCGAI